MSVFKINDFIESGIFRLLNIRGTDPEDIDSKNLSVDGPVPLGQIEILVFSKISLYLDRSCFCLSSGWEKNQFPVGEIIIFSEFRPDNLDLSECVLKSPMKENSYLLSPKANLGVSQQIT